MNHAALLEPQIPASTGNIARTCVTANAPLHLIKPSGFSADDKHLGRAGLDYWDDVNITYHKDLATFLAHVAGKRLYLVTKFAYQTHSGINYNDGENHYSPFGKETAGLPETFM